MNAMQLEVTQPEILLDNYTSQCIYFEKKKDCAFFNQV